MFIRLHLVSSDIDTHRVNLQLQRLQKLLIENWSSFDLLFIIICNLLMEHL